jgi:competence protein ComEA
MSDASTTDPSTHGAGGATAPGGEEIYVHVLGAVHTPGLFTLSADARVVDAIAAAGGFTADADTGSVNLARAVADGEQLVVRRPGEVPPPQADASGGTGASGGAPGPTTPIPLNSASAAELESLPRIGPALAERIVQWRTDNGPFRLVDELLQVPGIGEAILAGLEGLVTT